VKRSIQAVLLGGTIAVLVAVLGGAAWVAYEAGLDEAEELFDARLATSARVLEAMMARQLETATIATPLVIVLPEPLERLAEDDPSPLGHYYETQIAFQVRDEGGRILARSASAPEAPLAPLAAGFSTQATWRVFSLRSGHVWVQVAESDHGRSEMSGKLAWAAVLPLLAGIPVVLLLLSLLIRYGLAPLSQLAARIAAREPGSVAPLALSRTPAEIAPVLEALNGLLARVQAALERERRFTADAAHELRTPLAALQVHAQNAARAEGEAERRESLERMLAGLQRTTRLAVQMLELSRASAPRAAFAPTSLAEVVQEAARQLNARVELSGESTVNGDRDQLLSLITNLLDNALRHGGGKARVELAGTTLAVLDEGPGIPEAERERVFESYYRVPGSAGAGSGLGLAIVREIAAQHGARVEIGAGPAGRGTRVSVIFPEKGSGPFFGTAKQASGLAEKGS
jgi:two-component system sensor histidine kinase QseC